MPKKAIKEVVLCGSVVSVSVKGSSVVWECCECMLIIYFIFVDIGNKVYTMLFSIFV